MHFLMKIWMFSNIILLCIACAPARYVKPLNQGEHALQANFGGPITKVPGIGAIPLPLTSIGYGYGLRNRVSVFANIHTTSLLFGIGQFDIGASYCPWKNEKMGLSVQPILNTSIDFYTGANRFWPQIDVNYYFDYRLIRTKANKKGFQKTNSFYAGISSWFDPYRVESQGRPNEQFWIPSINLGHIWKKNQWSYQAEMKVLAPIYSNQNIVVDYPSVLGNYGALGAYFSVYYQIKQHDVSH